MPLNCTGLVQPGRCGSQASSGTVIKCHTCAAQSGCLAMTATLSLLPFVTQTKPVQ